VNRQLDTFFSFSLEKIFKKEKNKIKKANLWCQYNQSEGVAKVTQQIEKSRAFCV
jgi:hypothetical protein